MFKGNRWYEWAVIGVIAILGVYVYAHVVAYLSVNWGSRVYPFTLYLAWWVLSLCRARQYITATSFMHMCAIILWQYGYGAHITYWQWYALTWVYFCLKGVVKIDSYANEYTTPNAYTKV